jgi:Viral BACON domain
VAAPVLSVSPLSLSFAATQGAAGPSPQTLSVANTGGGSLPFAATASAPWLTVSASGAAAPATLTVTANPAGLAAGTYNATVTVDGGGVGAGTASAFRTAATATGAMAKLNVYLDSANRATRRVAGVYANASGHPGRLLTQATLTSVTSGAWNALTVPKASVAAGTTYWIAVLSPSGRGTLQIRDKFGGGRSETSSQRALTTLPATWTTGQTWPDGPLSATGGP